MSFLNGLAGLGSGLTAFAGEAAKDQQDTLTRASLLNSTPAAATPADATTPPAATTPAAPAAATPAVAGPRMPAGQNPYGTGPNAQALWAAELAIKGPESGGKADAQNPVSSAGGLFQIINPTWDASMQKLGLPVASSDAERNAQKYNPDLNTQVMRSLNSDAAAALDKAGLPVTVQTLQAAHRLGPGGAAAAIKAAAANPNAPLVGNGLAPDAVRGNGDVARLSVSEFLQSPYPTRSGNQ